MAFNSMSEDEQFVRAMQECPVSLPSSPNDVLWKYFFVSLYSQVIAREESEKRKRKDKFWDFCIIHSSHAEDFQISRHFIRLMETSLGISGKSIGDIAHGENTLEAASTMVQGSSKVFILVSHHLEHASVPRFIFQETLMQQLLRPDWRCKIVPMYLPGFNGRPPFYVANIQGFRLNDDITTVELVSGAITIEEQMQVRAMRQRNLAAFHARLKKLRQQQLQEIKNVIAGLRKSYGDDYDPNEQLQQAMVQLNSTSLSGGGMGGPGQIINMSGCEGVSFGTSIHYHGSQQDNDASSNSSATSGVESPIYFNPDTYSGPSSDSTVLTNLSSKSMDL